MPDNLKINIKVNVDGKSFKAEVDKLKRTLNALSGSAEKAGDAAQEASKDTDALGDSMGKIGEKGRPGAQGVRQVGKEADTARQRVKGLNSGLGTLARRLGAIAAGYVGFQAVKGLGRQIDAYTELNNRIRLVADSERELIGIREELFAISLRTRSSMAANTQLYSRLAQASKDLGISQADLLKVTEILNKQVLIGGNNATEAAAGLVQFAQGIASGRLQGDELRSVMENLLGVQQGLIDGFKILYETGQIDFQVTRSNIRKFASEGVLNSDLLLKALLAVADKTEERFQQVTVTIGGAFQNLFTALFARLGLLEEGASAGSFIAGAVQSLAEVTTPETQSEQQLARLAEQVRRGSIRPQFLGLKELEGLAERARGELQREREYQAAPGSYYGGGFEKLSRRSTIESLEKEVALYEELARQKNKQIELNARLAPKDLGKYKASDAVAAIGAGLQTDEERIRAEDRRQRAILEKELEAARQDQSAARQRLASLTTAQAASRVDNLTPQIEEAKDSLQSFADGVAELEKNLGRLDEQTASRLANTSEALKKRAEQAKATAQAEAQARQAELQAARKRQRFNADLARFFKEQAKERDAAVASLDERELGFLNPFERERRELKKWVEETRKALQTGGDDYAKHRARVDDIHAKSLDDIAKREREAQRQAIEERIKNSREAAVGLLRGIEEYAREATNAAAQVQEATKRAFVNIEDQLVRLITKGKFSFKQFARDLAEDSARAVVRVGITGPVANRLGAALRGRLGLKAPPNPAKAAVDKLNTDLMAKQNQIIDAGQEIEKKAAKQVSVAQQQLALLKRIADCSCAGDQRLAQLQQFRVGGDSGGVAKGLLQDMLNQLISRGVPRFHSGGVVRGRQGEEVLTLLEGGEVVRTRAQEAALAARGAGGPPQQVQVVVENRGANQQEVVEQRAEVEGSRLVVHLALEDIGRRGPLSQGLERAYGLRRRTG